MDLTVCIVTNDVEPLIEFYESVLGIAAQVQGDYAEFRGDGWTLALVTNESIDFAAPGAHVPRSNRAVRVELSVDDVDAEYRRLTGVVSEWVTEPTSWPWGSRAVWFRDPDGNLVSLYSFNGSRK